MIEWHEIPAYRAYAGSLILIAGLACALLAAPAHASPTSREKLQQYTTQLQANPSDDALRTRIIRLALRLHPKPAIPDAALEDEGAAEYAFKHAQSPADFANAAAEYEKALLLAPWNAGDYFNLGICYGKAGDLRKAIAEYHLYLLAAPHAQDADAVTKEIGALKYQLTQKEAAETAQRQQEEQEQQEEEAQQRQEEERQREQAQLWSGVWRVTSIGTYNPETRTENPPTYSARSYYGSHFWFSIDGNKIFLNVCVDRSWDDHPEGSTGVVYVGTVSGHTAVFTWGMSKFTAQMDSSGDTIHLDGPSIPTYTRVNDPSLISTKCPH